MIGNSLGSVPSASEIAKAKKKQKKVDIVIDESILNINQTIGHKLRQLRKKHGITQAHVAYFVLFSTQAGVSDLERGKKEISINDLVKLCNHFEQPLEYFLGRFSPGFNYRYKQA